MDPSPALPCPRCRTESLDHQLIRSCARCEGQWISETALADRVATMRSTPRGDLVWGTEARAAVACPACRTPMETLRYAHVPVDRCRAHGVWFDAGELAAILLLVYPAAAAAEPADPGTAAAVVEGALDVASEVGVEVAAEAGTGVLEVVIGGVGYVAEGVVTVIGELVGGIVDGLS